jgi:signal transduction histidine kinase
LSAGKGAYGTSNGRGLRVMRERAAVLGGEVTAGEVDGTWVVRARLPIPSMSIGTT